MTVPQGIEECNHRQESSGGDPGPPAVRGHWLDSTHGYAETADFYVCLPENFTARAALNATGTITVAPAEASANDSNNGILRFEVRVASPAAGELDISVRSTGSGYGMNGPEVEADGDGWHFVSE